MGNKRKQQQAGIPKQNQSFAEMMSAKQLAALKPFIEEQVRQASQQMMRFLAQKQASALQQMFLQISVLETVVMEKFSDITEAGLAARYSELEDKTDGFVSSSEPVKTGDRIRVQMRVKPLFKGEELADQGYGQESRHLIDNVGTGSTFGEEIEKAMLGLKVGEIKEIPVGNPEDPKSKPVVIEVKIERISQLVGHTTTIKETPVGTPVSAEPQTPEAA